MEKLYGSLEQVLSCNQKDNETVAKIKLFSQDNTCAIIAGKLSSEEMIIGSHLIVEGSWNKHPSYGLCFHTSSYTVINTGSSKGIYNYLTSKLIKGIGPKIAEKIIAKFHQETSSILDTTPERLIEIPGISESRCSTICKQLYEQKSLRFTLLFLQQYDIAIHYGIRIYKKYKEKTISTICSDPFILAREMEGVGFKTADTIAIKLGIPLDSKNRICAGILHILEETQEDGHTCYPLSQLAQNTSILLSKDILNNTSSIEIDKIIQYINDLYDSKAIYIDEINHIKYVWSRHLYLAEKTIAKDLIRIQNSSKNLREIHVEKALHWVQSALNLELAEKQSEAVQSTLTKKIHIITGGPGTGKSTITKAILKIFEQITFKIILAAPTGKAAKRMSEITLKHAVTIHSLLQYDFKTKSFRRNREYPIDCDLIIVDESGMIDTYLLYHLLKAIPDNAVIVFIGDVHQLPSVGPGNILKDLINSQKISVTELNKIFRQLQDSGIVTNAHRINQGLLPELYNKSGRKDFLFFQKEDPQEALDHIIEMISVTIPQKYHIYDKDIQVLSPMKKGILGIHHLNKTLKHALNPQNKIIYGKYEGFSVGDKVMQIRNNYSKEVFNGDIGYVVSIKFSERELVVNIDGKHILYSFSELDDLILAYATSVHKYQGSESPCIIIPIHTSHFMMLYRNLLYTAITRGKKLVVLVGTQKALAIATNNNKVQYRNTGLLQAIVNYQSCITTL